MGLVYDVFRDDGRGGPVDYSAAVATAAGTSAVVPQPAGTAFTYAVRARDTASGLSDGNTDARAAASVSPQGVDLQGVPRPPAHARAVPTAGGGADVVWSYPHRSGPKPLGFRVYAGVGAGAPNYASPAAAVPYRGEASLRASLPPMPPGAYRVGVRAWNAAGEEANTYAVTFTPMASAPAPVAGLTATASY
jgi:hypothetical protein